MRLICFYMRFKQLHDLEGRKMLHTVKMKGRRVANIDSPQSDLAGHTVTRYSQNTDVMKILFDHPMWKGFKRYSVIFWRDGEGEETQPRKEYTIDYNNPQVVIPGSLTTEPGHLRFAIKALDPDTGRRLMSADENGFFEITDSGVIDGSFGNEDMLTDLEQAIEKAEQFEDLNAKLEELLERAQSAVERAESIADLDYKALINKPEIEDTQLLGNKVLQDIGLSKCDINDIIEMFK